jgi:scyllo-inositol 2-dehydrogenase (NADP+)
VAPQILRVGILGQGRSGRNIHAEYLKQAPDLFALVAVADKLRDRGERAEREYGCASYTDYHELLARRDIDLVVNALPSYLHVPVSHEILGAGFHCLCEKPLARHATEVDELIAHAEHVGKRLAIFQQSRFAPYFQQVRKVIASGALGRIVTIKVAFNGFGRRWDWQTLQEMNGGSLLNTGPHPLDQALQLFGTDLMPRIWCHMDRATTFGDAEDCVKLLLTGEGRPLIDLEIYSCSAYPRYTYEIYGSQGGLAGTTTHIDWKYFDPAQAPAQTLQREPLPGPSYCSEQLPWQEESWVVPSEHTDLFGSMSAMFYNNLYQAITTGTALEATPQQVRQQIAVIEECHRQNPLSRLPS